MSDKLQFVADLTQQTEVYWTFVASFLILA